ncbi:MAG: DNA polymerase III subunit gamma/tau, partial [Synergistaceae bacterium]|nr:DNA polymerase III subunit gamma/tau [Synergistaceae bacterium]
MRVSLYRKFRPQLFSEIVEQKAATDMLRTSFVDGRLGQAYLFSGPRGCGKTTAARILAKAVNCMNPSEGEPCCACDSCRAVASGDHLDVMEIDGASNRGIDQIRELKSHVGLASFMGGSKVYILDEVHMLTTEAFNALLKTLEEPPPRVLFIFATTEPNKVPVTIRSRCQHIPFHRISSESIAARLRDVAMEEGFEADDSALWEIARNADGALRDALSLAEQAIALGNGRLSSEATRGLFGGGSRAELERFIPLLRSSPAASSSLLKELLGKGVSPERFLDALFTLFRDMWVFGLWGDGSFAGVSLSGEEKDFLRGEAPRWPVERLRRSVRVCASLFPRARQGLKSDVFSGLLLFELLNAESEPNARLERSPAHEEDIPVRPARSVEPDYAERRAPDAPAGSEPPAKRAEMPVTADSLETQVADLPEGIKGAFSSLWDGDLALCAAMIDASISLAEGKLVIDC